MRLSNEKKSQNYGRKSQKSKYEMKKSLWQSWNADKMFEIKMWNYELKSHISQNDDIKSENYEILSHEIKSHYELKSYKYDKKS